jgi:CobQ-like glutamine amidotransferase family enzyme
VEVGVGNGDGTEGARQGRVVGTYLHGPVLARNPALADLILSWIVGDLDPLDDAEVTELRDERRRFVAADQARHEARRRWGWWRYRRTMSSTARPSPANFSV